MVFALIPDMRRERILCLHIASSVCTYLTPDAAYAAKRGSRSRNRQATAKEHRYCRPSAEHHHGCPRSLPETAAAMRISTRYLCDGCLLWLSRLVQCPVLSVQTNLKVDTSYWFHSIVAKVSGFLCPGFCDQVSVFLGFCVSRGFLGGGGERKRRQKPKWRAEAAGQKSAHQRTGPVRGSPIFRKSVFSGFCGVCSALFKQLEKVRVDPPILFLSVRGLGGSVRRIQGRLGPVKGQLGLVSKPIRLPRARH